MNVGDFVIMSDGLNCSYIPYVNGKHPNLLSSFTPYLIATIYDKKFSTEQHQDYLKSGTFVYDPELIEFARNCGRDVGLELMDGCYSVWPLPNFETAADIQFTKEIGSLVSGASTVPEQTAATLLGVKCLGFAAVTNPATGTTDGSWVHDGEHNLLAAQKCLIGLRKTIWKVIEKFSFKPDYKFQFSLLPHDQPSLQVKKIDRAVDIEAMRSKLI